MTIEEMRALSFSPESRKKEIEDSIKQLLTEKSELISKQNSARENGNAEEYLSLQLAIESIDENISKIGSEYENPAPTYNDREIRNSWNEYIGKQNKLFEKKLEAYKRTRQELCMQFVELANMQKETLRDTAHVRNLLFARKKETVFSGGLYPPGMKKPALMKRNPIDCAKYNGFSCYPDLAFFVEGEDLPQSAISTYNETLMARLF